MEVWGYSKVELCSIILPPFCAKISKHLKREENVFYLCCSTISNSINSNSSNTVSPQSEDTLKMRQKHLFEENQRPS